jgi:hypothetical protein
MRLSKTSTGSPVDTLWQRNSSGEEKGYHILYGSWRLQMDWKPVDLF